MHDRVRTNEMGENKRKIGESAWTLWRQFDFCCVTDGSLAYRCVRQATLPLYTYIVHVHSTVVSYHRHRRHGTWISALDVLYVLCFQQEIIRHIESNIYNRRIGICNREKWTTFFIHARTHNATPQHSTSSKKHHQWEEISIFAYQMRTEIALTLEGLNICGMYLYSCTVVHSWFRG